MSAFWRTWRLVLLAGFLGALPSLIVNLIQLFGFGVLVKTGLDGVAFLPIDPYRSSLGAILYWMLFYAVAWGAGLFFCLGPITLLVRRWRLVRLLWLAALLLIGLYFWVIAGGLSGSRNDFLALGYWLPLFTVPLAFDRLLRG